MYCKIFSLWLVGVNFFFFCLLFSGGLSPALGSSHTYTDWYSTNTQGDPLQVSRALCASPSSSIPPWKILVALSPKLGFLFLYLHESTGVCFPSLCWGLKSACRHKTSVIIKLPFFSLLRYHTQSCVVWCLENHCSIYFVQISSYFYLLRQDGRSDTCYSILTKTGTLFESSWLEQFSKEVRDSILVTNW